MLKTIKTQEDMLSIFKGLKAAVADHAQNIATIIEPIFNAVSTYKDINSHIVLTSNGGLFRLKGSLYRLSYHNNQILLVASDQKDTIIASFDNNSSVADVDTVFRQL
ncbi:hypothetical protein GC096_25480 [Paenibacillus sp. LMG 31461]|uniref:Uncharacterized protein n=1 Tax=Paenibacillus plantarum TaxID=2654975 RepID=A0ABX1XH51_9BACL|nr:hypothetical protein [Paenibacillus plantarum]NOU67401.1 hypothetical protein [Paenibacillus plantarum]